MPSVPAAIPRIPDTSMKFLIWEANTLVNPDQKLAESWKTFVKAVRKDDFVLLKSISADCIACETCHINTREEDSISHARYLERRDINEVYEEDIPDLSFEEFIKNDYRICFSDNLKSRIADSAMVKAHHDYGDWGYCISKGKKSKMVEFFIYINEVSEIQPERGRYAILFIETKEGYKFCGYSTVP